MTGRRLWAAMALVAGVAAAVYANTLQNRFAYDDYHIVVSNTALQQLETLPGAVFGPYWPGMFGRENGLWRPVTQAALGLQWIVGGGAPWIFHAVNTLVHAGVSALVFLVLLELVTPFAAVAGALLFAVHPVHTEAVANVVGLGELLAALFFLAACLVHLRSGPATGWRTAAGIAVLYVLAFGAKEGAATLPAVLVLLDAARERLGPSDVGRYLARRWRLYFAAMVGAAALLLLRWDILGRVANPLGPLGADLLFEVPRIWTLGEVWGHYVRLWVAPLDLSADYSPEVIPVSLGWHGANVTGVGLALAILTGAWLSWRQGVLGRGAVSPRALGFGVVWFLITVAPVANVVFLSGVLLAERTLYLPSVGLAAATGWLFWRLAQRRRRLAMGLLVVACALGAWRTWTRNPTWRDNPSMLEALVRDYPQSGRSQWALGDAFMGAGNVSQALLTYRIGVDLLDAHYLYVTDVAATLMRHGIYHGTEGLLLHAWRREPRFALAPGRLAELYSIVGDPERAERFSRVSLTLEPRDPLRPHILAWSLAVRGRIEEARLAHQEAVRTQGFGASWQAWVTRAVLDEAGGDRAAALRALEAALSTDPPHPVRVRIESMRARLEEGSPLLGPPEPEDTPK